MPSQSTLSADDKLKVKSVIPVSPATNKIFYATLARIYYAHPSPSSWSYAGLQGALAFTRDNVSGACNFKLVDLNGTRGVIWEHELYQGLEYNADRGWFHSFAGDECMIGFVFSDEGEAKDFWKKVLDKKDAKIKSKSKKSTKSPTKSSGKIDKSMISAPTTGSFKHLGHMGYDAEKGFTSKGVDPSWSAFLGQLESTGIDQETIAQNMDFIKDFVKTHPQQQQQSPKKPKTKPPPPRARASVVPPPPPPPRSSIQRPSQPELESPQPPAPPARPAGPPPPPTRSSIAAPPPPPARSSTIAPPPPPPAARPSGPPIPPPPPARPSANSGPPPPPPPPPPPASHSGAPPPPPPPPPPPGGHPGGPPPPPPPPGGHSGGPPPPPPPPPPLPTGSAHSGLPAPQPGRNDLLASIQGKGIHTLRKTEPSVSPTSPSPGRSGTPAIEESSSSGGGDLTSALASALMARNAKMGEDSDEEEEDDDWD